LSALSSGTPAQKTADRTKSEMATDGANDVVQVVCWILTAAPSLLKVLVPAQKTADTVRSDMSTGGANDVVQVVCWI
jgi:hypothetical protein